jgi:hypothetical protein
MDQQDKPIETLLHTLADQSLPEDISQFADEEMERFSRAIELLEAQKPALVLWLENAAQWLALWSHRLIASTAVATLLLAGFFLLNMPKKALAWSDVQRAFADVSHVHISAVLYDPQRVSRDDDDPPDYRGLEFYYQAPQQYRGHGMGLVHFVIPAANRVYDVEAKQFLKSDDYRKIIPEPLIQAGQEGKSLLDSILMMVFQGNVPEKEPVLNTTLPVESGIEIFDYAHSGVEMWARIWVLKETQLPLRVKMFTPRYNESTLLVFDYSDPKSEMFFNIEYFEGKARSGNNKKPHQFYRIGDEQVLRAQQSSTKQKAINAAQIHDIQGIVPPELKRLEVSDNGDILIVVDDPENMSKNGGHIEGMYRDELQDNWGNVYHRYFNAHDSTRDGDFLYGYYTPMPPFHTGQGEHRLKLLYTTWGYQGGLGYDQIIEDREVVIPPATVKGIPDHWYHAENARKPFWKLQAYRLFMAGGGLGSVEQMEWVDQILAEHPDSSQILDYKLRLIERLQSADAAFAYFKQHRLESLMLEQKYTQCMYNEPLKKYLLHLYNTRQISEFNRLQQRFLEKQTAFLSTKERNSKWTKDRIKNLEDTLPRILCIPQAVEQMQAGKKPEIVTIIKSSDGVLFIEMTFPGLTKDQDHRQVFNGRPSVEGATYLASDSLKSHALYQYQTNEEELTLNFRVGLEFFLPLKNKVNPGTMTRFVYPVTVQVPPASDKRAEQIRMNLERWRPALAKRQEDKESTSQASSLYRLRRDAQKASREGDCEQAVKLYRSAMDCNIPEDLIEWGPVEAIKIRVRARLLLDIAQCRIQQEDYARALDLTQQVQGLITDTAEDQRHYMLADYGHARHVQVQIAVKYIERNTLDEAQALLEQIGQQHPDLRRLRDLHTLRQRPNGTYTWNDKQRRHAVCSQWLGYYRAQWRLKKAREGARL